MPDSAWVPPFVTNHNTFEVVFLLTERPRLNLEAQHAPFSGDQVCNTILNYTHYRPPGGGRFYVMVLKKLYDLPRTYISL
jgi:hypothetical protein